MMDEREMARQARRAVRHNKLALAILAGLVLLLAAGYGLWRCQRTYTPDKWASAPDERLDILGDLLERYDLVGMTEEEAHRALRRRSMDRRIPLADAARMLLDEERPAP